MANNDHGAGLPAPENGNLARARAGWPDHSKPLLAIGGLSLAGLAALALHRKEDTRPMINVSDYPTAQHAANALKSGGMLVFPPGIHPLTAPVAIKSLSDIRISGPGATLSARGKMPALLAFEGCSRVRIDGLAFDQGGGRLAVYDAEDFPAFHNVAVRCESGCDGIAIEACSFFELYTASIYFKDSASLRLTDCDFASPPQQQGHRLEFVHLQTFAGESVISGNGFSGAPASRPDHSPAAVAMSGGAGSISIRGNRAQWCGRNNADGHRLAVFDIYADCRNVAIRDNQAHDCLEQFARLSTCVDVSLADNSVSISRFASRAPSYSAITVESGSFPTVPNAICKRIRIEGNTIADPGRCLAFMIGVLAYDWGAAPADISIVRNTLSGSEMAFFLSGPFENVEISRNRASDVVQFLETRRGEGLTSSLGTQSTARYESLVVDDNQADIRAGGAKVPVSISLDSVPPFDGHVGDFYLRRNTFRAVDPATAIAVNVIVNASRGQGRLVAADNIIDGYPTPFLIRSLARATITGNQVSGQRALIAPGSSRYGVLDARANR